MTGGGINQCDADVAHAWMIKPTEADGKKFGDIYTRDYNCTKFLGKNFKMVDHIKNLRNKKVYDLMLDLGKEEDPNEENPQNDGSLSMPKRELFDKLPPTLTINVTTTSMVASVDVLPSWRTHGVLQIEITQTNLDLLLEEPRAEPAPFRPELGHGSMQMVGQQEMEKGSQVHNSGVY